MITKRDTLLSALALLTRLPLPDHRPVGAEGAWAWPLVGALLGAIAALIASILLWFSLPAGPVAAITLAALALLTGFLHEDGLADTADGLLGGRDKWRRLEIMKDSRIGSFGAVALLLVMLCSWSALTTVLMAGQQWPVLIAAAALSRAPMAVLMAALRPARMSGLSAGAGRPSTMVASAAVAIGLAFGILLLGTAALPALIAATVTTFLLASAAQRLIGGQTGDILGASQQLAFAAILAVLA